MKTHRGGKNIARGNRGYWVQFRSRYGGHGFYNLKGVVGAVIKIVSGKYKMFKQLAIVNSPKSTTEWRELVHRFKKLKMMGKA